MNLTSETEKTSFLNNNIFRFWKYISKKRKIQLLLLVGMMLASGLAELISLGTILPFLAVLNDPNQVWDIPAVQRVAIKFGFNDSNELVFPLTSLFIGASILTASVRLCNLWLNLRLSALIGSDLSCEAYRRTLFQDYEVHVNLNTSSVITTSTTHINVTVKSLNSVLNLVTAAIVAVVLLLGLLLIDGAAALGAAILFGSAYSFIAFNTRRELQQNGRRIAIASKRQIKALQEGLGAIRDVVLDGNQASYLSMYKQADLPQREFQARNAFLSSFPRYTLEALGMIAIAILAYLLVINRSPTSSVIPLLGALALGAQRLLPAMQQIYSGWSTIRGYNASMQAVLEMLRQPLPPEQTKYLPLQFKDNIKFESIYYRYGKDLPYVLNGFNLKFSSGDRIGVIGSTGSGKSTLIDLLMGLLKPTSGKILVDGRNIHNNQDTDCLYQWRASISHVPQTVYLADCTIAENIAFGVSKSKINMKLVNLVAKQACIHEFIESTPGSYEGLVGERGIRLSGGQRQRLGIARALYKQSKILVFDEATSALDEATESMIMDNINMLSTDITIIMIAHRLTTIKRCNKVVHVKKGKLFAIGSPDEILKTSII
jgi:ATP-binding cassette, subfamily B, bacterial PglK